MTLVNLKNDAKTTVFSAEICIISVDSVALLPVKLTCRLWAEHLGAVWQIRVVIEESAPLSYKYTGATKLIYCTCVYQAAHGVQRKGRGLIQYLICN